MTICTQIIPELAIFHVNLRRTGRKTDNSSKTAQNGKFSIRTFGSAIGCDVPVQYYLLFCAFFSFGDRKYAT
jgi:hypothetical protein